MPSFASRCIFQMDLFIYLFIFLYSRKKTKSAAQKGNGKEDGLTRTFMSTGQSAEDERQERRSSSVS